MPELTYPLTTLRMTLRPYALGDLTDLYGMFSREDVCRYLPWPPMNMEQARAKLEQRFGQTRIDEDGGRIVIAAIESASGRHVGEFMLKVTNVESRQGEIGWSLHPDAHGRGLATEGAREMLRLGFDEVGLHRIIAECDPRNGASIRVMERLGMRREADFAESWFLKGEWVGSTVFAMLASEWRESAA